jgi:hypothetical protein
MIWLIIGRRTRGKTTLGYYMARKAAQRLIFDPRGMIGITGPRTLRVERLHDLRDRAMPALMDRELDEVVYAPQEDDLTRPFYGFAEMLKWWITEVPRRPLAVLIDELSFIDQTKRDPAVLRRVLRSCDPAIFDVFITCHRPADIPTNTRGIADYWVLFHCTQEHDLDVVRDRCNTQTAAVVQSLKGRSFVVWDDAKSTIQSFPESGQAAWHVPLRPGTEPPRSPGQSDANLSGLEQKEVDTGKLPL